MSVKFLKRYYIDPFTPEPMTNFEIVEVESILFYSKRKKRENVPNFEMKYSLITASIIGGNFQEKLKEWRLDIFSYITLLESKSKEIQDKFNYNKTELKTLNFHYFDQDIIVNNDLDRFKLRDEMLSQLGIEHTNENDQYIRSLIEDVDVYEFNKCIINPYLRK